MKKKNPAVSELITLIIFFGGRTFSLSFSSTGP